VFHHRLPVMPVSADLARLQLTKPDRSSYPQLRRSAQASGGSHTRRANESRATAYREAIRDELSCFGLMVQAAELSHRYRKESAGPPALPEGATIVETPQGGRAEDQSEDGYLAPSSSRLCGLTREGLPSFTGDRGTLCETTHRKGPPDMNEPERPAAEPVASRDRSQQSENRRPDHGASDPSRESVGDRGVVVIQRYSRHRRTGADHRR